jgi:TPR repeat protein
MGLVPSQAKLEEVMAQAGIPHLPTDCTQPQPIHHTSSKNAPGISSNTTSSASIYPAPLLQHSLIYDPSFVQDDPGQSVRDQEIYAQYLENRAEHLDELHKTYKSWKSSECPQTLFKLAMVYVNGSHPYYPRNANTALKYFQLAAEQGHHDAIAYIALFHLAGVVLLRSPATALSILCRLAEIEHAPSMFWLATLHLRGPKETLEYSGLHHFLPKDILATTLFIPDNIQITTQHRAFALLRSSSELGYPPAQDELSWYYFANPADDFSLGYSFSGYWMYKFSRSADQLRFENNGNTSLHLRDALAYIDSVDIVDHVQLLKLLRPACDEGSSHAWYLLGLIYRQQSDPLRAQLFFRKAAIRGSPEAQCEVGLYYYSNPPKDLAHAVGWFIMALEQGHRDAFAYLANMQQRGEHFTKNPAATMYFDAAQLGHHNAQLQLARCYHEGNGTAKVPELAAEWYTKVINTPLADVADAIKHVTPSSARLHADCISEAQLQLGLLYAQGELTAGFSVHLTSTVESKPTSFVYNQPK